MVEMAASASVSLAARSLAVIVPGAGSWRNETFGAPPSSVNSVDIPPGSMARHMVAPAPVSSAALRSLKTVIATRPMRTSLGRRWGNMVNEGLRTSDSYAFTDPSPAADRPISSKSEKPTGTPNQDFSLQ